ncbi:MAG: allophanate hydrolase subunit 1 [Chloroflexi bacterium]|nr:allophanate hydrolase subunit 1 [Chloroflexota bacterium]
MTGDFPRLLPAGDSAILIEFADEIRDDVNDRVHAFAQLLDGMRPQGAKLQTIPAYSSLLVCYDPREISFNALRDQLNRLITQSPNSPSRESRVIEIPTRYGGANGPDLEFVARHNGISEEPRLETPRTRVPMGSVGIAGRQTGVYPAESPGGWRLIGRTDLKMFDAQREEPSLLRAGDLVKFVEIL